MPWSSSGSLKGPTGPAGPTGATGVAGATGAAGATGPAGLGINFKGTVATFANLPGSPADGDGYLVANEADRLYVWDQGTTTWVDGGSIQGPAGPGGATGATGPAGTAGGAGSTGATGPGGTPGGVGATGARGTNWYTGTGPPPAEIAGSLPGDKYLDLVSGIVYTLTTGVPVGSLPAIGASYDGGYYGGLISQSANGTPTHALIVAPASTGQNVLATKTANTLTPGTSSTFDGLANTDAANSAGHPAAQWAKGLTIGGKTDWYVPALYELEILYRNFKPDNSEGNVTTHGANAFAVPSATGNYTLSVPGTTTVTAFQLGNAQAFFAGAMATSTQDSATTVISQDWYYGNWDPVSKTGALTVRAIRKVAVVP